MQNKQYHTISRQSGMSFIGWILLLVVVGFVLVIAFRTVPVYLTKYKVDTAMKEIQKNPDLQSASLRELQDALRRRFNINQVNAVKASDAKVKKMGNGVRVFSLPYQQIKPVFGGVHLLFKFKPEARLESR